MSRDILMLADALAREKNVAPEVVFGALESALAHATKKRFSEDVNVRVVIDHKNGRRVHRRADRVCRFRPYRRAGG